MKNKLFMLMIISLSTSAGLFAKEPPSRDEVGIDEHLIVMPAGRILLISRENFSCAIIFSESEIGKEGMRSKYEWFSYENGRFGKARTGYIWLRKQSDGIWEKIKGFLSLHDNPFRYGDEIEFTGFKLVAHPSGPGHSTVYFWNEPNEVDLKVRMAPTAWKSTQEGSPSGPAIRWFGYDKRRKWSRVEIEKVWDK
jgi:hypothetical protein